MSTPRWITLATSITAGALCLLALPAGPSQADSGTSEDRTIMVTLDSAQSDAGAIAEQAIAQSGGTVTEVRQLSPQIAAVTVSDVTTRETAAIETKAEAVDKVQAAETAGRVYPTKTDDTYYSYLWNLNNATGSTYGVDAEDAWPLSTGRNAVIGVVDTGITSHPDLNAHVIAGYDFVSNDTNPTDEGPGSGTDWHGTHVAGIAAALANNGKGVVGVAPNASIEPIRVMDASGGDDADLVAAILWGSGAGSGGAKKTNAHPADVLNLSLGSEAKYNISCPKNIQTAINAAVAKGTAVVVAAGNDSAALVRSYPANCKNIIRVAASGNDGMLAYYSNYGSTDFPATISAPGGSASDSYDSDDGHWILSTWNSSSKKATASKASYVDMIGTSMAAPHVAGVIALLRSVKPSLSVADMTNLITAHATPLSCSTTRCGAGVINAAATVAAALGTSVPSAHPSLTTPTITGTVRVGEKLAATTTASPAKATLSYQWLRSGKKIKGATAGTYRPVAKDRGKRIAVIVTATYGLSKARATSKSAKVLTGVLSNTVVPTVTGTAVVGKTVTASRGSWAPVAPTKFRYQWYRNGSKIKGATKKSYLLKAADRGKLIAVRVTVSRSVFKTASATSIGYLVA